MGENKHITELDAFAKKYVKEIEQEQPSVNFTATLMKSILEESKVKIIKPKALISKKGWAIITVLVLTIVIASFKKSKEKLFNVSEFKFTFLDYIQIPDFIPSITISNPVFYTILFFGLMIFAQVVFLKKHFNKRFY